MLKDGNILLGVLGRMERAPDWNLDFLKKTEKRVKTNGLIIQNNDVIMTFFLLIFLFV